MGIPDEPFWAPAELVEAYREHAAERGAASLRAMEQRSTPSTIDDGRVGRGVGRHRHRRMGRPPADVRAGREDRHPRGDREGVQRHARRRARPGRRRRRPHRQHRHQARRASSRQSIEHPGGRQIHYGIREHAMGSTMVGMADARRRPPGRRHVLRVPRLHAPTGAAAVAISGAKVVFVFTHDSVGVGEDGPTHQPVEHLATLRAIPAPAGHPPSRRQRDGRRRGRPPSPTTGPTALGAQPPGHRGRAPTARPSSRGAGVVRRRRRARSVVLVGTGSEVALCVEAAEALDRRGHRAPASSACRRGIASQAAAPSYQDVGAARRRAGAVGRGGGHVRLGALRRRHRSASTASAPARPATSCSTSSASTSTTSSSGRDALAQPAKEANHGSSRTTCTTSSARARGSTT